MRTKGIGALEEDIERKANALMQEFSQFTTGTRYLCLLHRAKDGGHNKEYHRRGGFYITHTPEEYADALARLLILQVVSKKPYRLYASVNARSVTKAEKQFKMEMLESDFAPKENHEFFWTRIESRWVGALMKPGSRIGSNFILDADGEGDVSAPVLKLCAENNIDVLKQYKTPNGYHVITSPFNPEIMNLPDVEVKKDGLILLSY